MDYSKVQKKITCGKEEQVIDETMYFHYDGYDATTISTWLGNSSVFHIIKCFLKAWWNRKEIQEKAIKHIEFQKKYNKLQDDICIEHLKTFEEKRQCAAKPSQS